MITLNMRCYFCIQNLSPKLFEILLQNQYPKVLQMSIIQLNSISIKNETTCGYCNGGKSNKLWVTSGFYCYKMQLHEYQQLMDRGWRRCGVYYYRPALAQSCCQAYALRVDTKNFKTRITHEKVLKRIKRIQLIENSNSDEKQHEQFSQYINQDEFTIQVKSKIQTDLDQRQLTILQKVGQHYTYKSIQYREEDHNNYFKKIIVKSLQNISPALLSESLNIVNNQDHIEILQTMFLSCLKELQIYEITVFRGQINKIESDWTFGCNFIPLFYSRVEAKLKYLYPNLKSIETNSEFKDLINSYLQNLGFEFKISQWDNQLLIKTEETIKDKLYKSTVLYYLQKADQNMPEHRHSQSKKKNQIEIKWVKAQFQADSFELYQRYQRAIHGKERVSKQSYVNFVCLDALDSEDLGCWHMKYYLENQLIAVGVVDLLPESVSSVYFFYDPNYKKYSLGVYGVLSEIQYIKEKQQLLPELKYYYMGFYIMDSKKMAYKGLYTPCQLLCPQTYRWISLTKQIKEKIKKITEYSQDVRLADEKDKLLLEYSISQEGSTIEDMDLSGVEYQSFIQQNVKISQFNKIYSIQQLKKNYRTYFMNLFENFLGKIGKQLMTEFLFAVS